MSLEIIAFPPSPRAFKVMAVADHLGLDWSLRVVDLGNAQGGARSASSATATSPSVT